MKKKAELTSAGAVLLVLSLAAYAAAIAVGALFAVTGAFWCVAAGTVLFAAAMIFNREGR